jgi:hypothetical protein
MPGAAFFFNSEKAAFSRSGVTWCKSAVNFTPLSLFAACRTRSSALGAFVRLCVRGAFCWLTFPLASSLPSTTSAAGALALFGGFTGTTELSDFR